MKYNIEMDTLEEKGTFLRKIANEEIEKKTIKLDKLKSALAWRGKAYESYYNKYTEIINNLHNITKTVDKLGFYMEYVSGKYDDADENVKDEYKKYKNEIDAINGKVVDDETAE